MKKHLLPTLFLFVMAVSCCKGQGPILWGMTTTGGASQVGTIFNYNTSTGVYTLVHSFGGGNDGYTPKGSLIQASNGLLYGTTSAGGQIPEGTVFSYDISTDSETTVINFDFTDGCQPKGSLLQAGNGLLYGVTSGGGLESEGVIFNYNTITGADSILANFDSINNGWSPQGSLVQAGNGLLYGLAAIGGVDSSGAIFEYDIATGSYSGVYQFGSKPTDGTYPANSLIAVSDSLLYGMTHQGGASDSGAIFSFNINTDSETVLYNFGSSDADGGYPWGSLLPVNDSLLYGSTFAGGAYGAGTLFSYNINTGTYSGNLHDFGNGTDGAFPHGSLIMASNGILYGTTEAGGANNSGTIFSYDLSTGIETDIHDCADSAGTSPFGDLLEDDMSTGIRQLPFNTRQLSLYPNPSSGQFTLILPPDQLDYPVEVYNMMGEKIYQSVLPNQQNIINLSNQPAGVYFIYVKTNDGVEVGNVMLAK